MYGRTANGELRKAELEEARLGFIQFLRRKNFSPQFIASHGDELFATAALEYSRKVAEGTHVESPAGWLITCAWRRTMSLLEAQGRSPRIVSTEKAEMIEDDLGQSPEEVALDEDRLRKVQEAVEQLSLEERRLLELAYFEGMAVREVARQLHWHPSKAQRCHEAARRRLHELLGVDSLDELAVEIGFAAYLSVAVGSSSGPQVRAAIDTAMDMASRGASDLWNRAQDLARRIPIGGAEPSTTAAVGGTAGRAAGVCATAAVACIAATGVVGPGLGGINVLGGGARDKPAAKPQKVVNAPRIAPLTPSVPPPTASPQPGNASTASAGRQRDTSAPASASTARRKRATRAVSSQSLESAAGSPEEANSPPVESALAAEASIPAPSESTASSSSSTPTQTANEQFGP